MTLWDHSQVPNVEGEWWDSKGNSIEVSQVPGGVPGELMAVIAPLVHNPAQQIRHVPIYFSDGSWVCGNATLEWWDTSCKRLVWHTEQPWLRRCIWTRKLSYEVEEYLPSACPWLLNGTRINRLPLYSIFPRDILLDCARVAAIMDMRQMIGTNSSAQDWLTDILMDHDLRQEEGGDYLIPSTTSMLWKDLRSRVEPDIMRRIHERIEQLPLDMWLNSISWQISDQNDMEIWVGRHKINVRKRDFQILEERWVGPPKDERKSLEIARLLALYSVFDNPLHNRRSGMHLAIEPEIRRKCDFEMFASPLNAAVPNGRFASKWPHIEWRFGSIGRYPSVIQTLPHDAIVCVNPPFTELYLDDVMGRLAELKIRFRLRLAIPIRDAHWRGKLNRCLPDAKLDKKYYNASDEQYQVLKHESLHWEDPRVALGPHGSLSETESTSARSQNAESSVSD